MKPQPHHPQKAEISWNDFEKLDIRVGTITEALPFPKARKPAYQLQIYFVALGSRWTSAQITDFYSPQDLINRQVIALINLPKKQIANFFSECLVLGIYNEDGKVILLQPEKSIPDGAAIG